MLPCPRLRALSGIRCLHCLLGPKAWHQHPVDVLSPDLGQNRSERFCPVADAAGKGPGALAARQLQYPSGSGNSAILPSPAAAIPALAAVAAQSPSASSAFSDAHPLIANQASYSPACAECQDIRADGGPQEASQS